MRVNPFLGARPYGVAHSGVFFGRDAATRELAQRIELYPVVAVVAPSGIGKTSLLRAAVIPSLERKGLLPVYLRPDPRPESGNDGALALLEGRLEKAVFEALLPDPALELASLEQIRSAWGTVSLQEAAQRFRRLGPLDDLKGQILTPRGDTVERLSMVARYLDETFDESALFEQWKLLDSKLAEGLVLGKDIGALAEYLAAPKLQAKLGRVRQKLALDGRAVETFAGLQRLAEAEVGNFRLIRPDGDLELRPRIVLVIDQFEQVFTLARQENRDALLASLAEMADAALPVHIVLALRKEWYAELSRYLVRQRTRIPGQSFETFHLDSMTVSEATEIMAKVPQSVGEPAIPKPWQEQLWENLQLDGALDPVALSIACHELFDIALDADDSLGESEVLGVLDVEELLGNYLHRALLTLDDDDDFDEALDILSQIAGSGTTREFVTQSDILDAPLRDRARRSRLLERLQQLYLIRGDHPRRGSEKLYDIMHERLIEPVRALIATRPDITGLRVAAERVVHPDAVRHDLDFEYLRAVLLAGDRLQLDSRSSGILLSSLLQLDWKERDCARVERLARDCGGSDVAAWYRTTSARLAVASSAPAPEGVSAVSRLSQEWWLTRTELRETLSILRGGDPLDEHSSWLLMSTLLRQSPSERTRRLIRLTLANLGGRTDHVG